MAKNRQYSIAFRGLKEGYYEFNFVVNKEFVELFSVSEFEDASITVEVKMTKRERLLEVEIEGEGTVDVACDRCLEIFPLPVEFGGKLLVKIDAEKSEMVDENLIHVAQQEDDLDLAQYLYESVMLSLPLKRVHPDDEDGGQTCDPEMVKKLKPAKKNNKKKESDPRWDALKNIQF